MASLAVALETQFAPYAPKIWQRCVNICQATLLEMQKYAHDPEEFPDSDYLVASLDLLSAMTQGLGSHAEHLFTTIQPSALQICMYCMNYSDSDVLQSTFALLGDMSISVFPMIKPHLHEILPKVIDHVVTRVDATQASKVNNAVWCIGEIALRHGANMEPFIQPIMSRLVPLLLSRQQANKSIPENVSITIGRLGLVCTGSIASNLGEFIVPMYFYCN
jgi:transportin-1